MADPHGEETAQGRCTCGKVGFTCAKTGGERMHENQFDATEAEASVCATLRVNGTACRAAALLPKVRTPFRRCRTLFEKCASWKIPMISSKMRTLFQGAHKK